MPVIRRKRALAALALLATLLPLQLAAAEPQLGADEASTQWSEPLGEYSYDAAGNITYVGSDSFEYYGAGRLTAATVTGHTQAYALWDETTP